MSFTSKELNYLIWRYFQEAGYDLSAYTFDRQSQCLGYENDDNVKIIDKIPPGCLVELVQKGILYTIAETEAGSKAKEKSEYTFLASLVQNELANINTDTNSQQSVNPSNITKSITNHQNQNHNQNQDHIQGQSQEKGQNIVSSLESNNASAVKSESHVGSNGKPEGDVEMQDVNGDLLNKPANESLVLEPQDTTPIDFETSELKPTVKFVPSITSSWHPSTSIFAYGKLDGRAICSTLKDGSISESKELAHPDLPDFKNEINMVSWSPLGDLLITAGAYSELRAWSPDGRLRNIANSANALVQDLAAEHKVKRSAITNIVWSPKGKFVATVDSENQMNIWDGQTLKLIRLMNGVKDLNGEKDPQVIICWFSDDKFAISSNDNHGMNNSNTSNIHTIEVFEIRPPPYGAGTHEVQAVGFLEGHENQILVLKVSSDSSMLLASCSDFDYKIKIWDGASSKASLTLNVKSETEVPSFVMHAAPIIDLAWIKYKELSVLLSISMDGVLNVWDPQTGKNIKSSQLYINLENFSESQRANFTDVAKDLLLLNSSLAPSGDFLALGDELGRITVWETKIDTFTLQNRSFMKCVAIYDPQIPDSGTKETMGICDLKWDQDSRKLIGSYVGLDSVILDVK